jgi:alcohol dehydrogenase (NADP+)
MPYPEKFTGFQVNSAETWLDFNKNEFQPKPFGDFDVDIKIECCGVCASDVHTINGEWGPQHYPLTVGHGETQLSSQSITRFGQGTS